MSELVCPTCKSADRLYSTETVVIQYPIRAMADAGDAEALGGFGYGAAGIVYVLGQSRTDDGSAVFQNEIWCRDCAVELTLDDLIPEPDGG